MKNIVIGTAGHIDHGKTTLIKALTGRETDRLKEEKKRGISIELGFTYFDLPSGRRAGIIDVPGHEKFIRNMLAGVGGMDIVMLVIAADEGVMPQTKEHLDILSLINIKKGIIVVTKAKMVDDEWLQLIKEDIREKVKNTFLKDADMIEVDSLSGYGIEELKAKIDQFTEEVETKDIHVPPRMPIDRVFTITGFGTVVTGTLVEGKVSIEDTLEILPDKVKVRIRNIQVHGQSVDTAYAGQRVAINLANVKKEEIERGEILAQINSMEETMMIDGKLHLLAGISRVVKNRERVRLYHGSSETLARVAILDREEIEPGQGAYVQFRLEEPTAVKKGDHIVVRFYSPMETIGGAVVIDGHPKKHKRYDQKVLQDLAVKEQGSPEDILEKQIERFSADFPDLAFLAKAVNEQVETVKAQLDRLLEKNRVVVLEKNAVLHIKYYDSLKEKIRKILEQYHLENPLKVGMLKEELKSRIFGKTKFKAWDHFMDYLQGDKVIRVAGKFVALYEFEITFTENQKKIKNLIEVALLHTPFSPPKAEEIIASIAYKKQEVEQVLEAITGSEVIRINNELLMHRKAMEEAQAKLVEFVQQNGSITLAEFRDLLDTSRKYAMAVIEYFDNQKVTKRLEDKRVLF